MSRRGIRGGSGVRIRARGGFEAQKGGDAPADKLVARKHGGHGHGRGQRRGKLGLVARGGRLLIRDDCVLQHVSRRAARDGGRGRGGPGAFDRRRVPPVRRARGAWGGRKTHSGRAGACPWSAAPLLRVLLRARGMWTAAGCGGRRARHGGEMATVKLWELGVWGMGRVEVVRALRERPVARAVGTLAVLGKLKLTSACSCLCRCSARLPALPALHYRSFTHTQMLSFKSPVLKTQTATSLQSNQQELPPLLCTSQSRKACNPNLRLWLRNQRTPASCIVACCINACRVAVPGRRLCMAQTPRPSF